MGGDVEEKNWMSATDERAHFTKIIRGEEEC